LDKTESGRLRSTRVVLFVVNMGSLLTVAKRASPRDAD
jgi:hypothetical protein